MSEEPLRTPAEKWAGRDCRLDGKPARISGRRMPFAVVTALDGSAAAQFAWETVSRVMNDRMEFFT